MALSLSRYGKLNMSYMESLTGTDQMILVNNLLSSGHIYQDPYDFLNNGRTTYFTANHYLSGNIREKIKLAKAAAEKDPTVFSRNVQDLSNVLPIELGPQDISLRLNSLLLAKNMLKALLVIYLMFLKTALMLFIFQSQENGKLKVKFILLKTMKPMELTDYQQLKL